MQIRRHIKNIFVYNIWDQELVDKYGSDYLYTMYVGTQWCKII